MTDFNGFPVAVLESENIRLEYLTTAGPRIVGLSFRSSRNMLAEVPEIAWDTPNGKYHPLGGHRLWTSPEAPETTYLPDESNLVVEPFPGGVELTWTGLEERKKIRIELEPDRPVVHLAHTITNISSRTLQYAPWVITMFRQGGTAILPQPIGNVDPHGLLPNRFLTLWPYTRLSDPRLRMRDDFILVQADSALPPIKLGYASTAGWLAYWNDGILFRKSFDMHPGASYPDGGCNAEVYCGDRFIELESLGMLGRIAPGSDIHLTETWELYPDLDVPFLPDEIQKLI
jgi:hypothetical protein